jgi:predicted PurR-regulated permease PerM
MNDDSRGAGTERAVSAPAEITVMPPRSGPMYPLLAFVLVVLAALGLREMASLIVPIVFGVFLALLASPLVDGLERRGASHRLALAAAIGVVLAVVLAVAAVIALSVSQLVVLIPRYEDRLSGVIGEISRLLTGFGIAVDPENIPGLLTPGALASFVQSTAGAIGRTAGALFVLAFTMIYALAGAPSLRVRAQDGLGGGHALLAAVSRFGDDLRRFLIVRAQLGLFAAVLVFVLLVALGVPLPALWSVLVFAASFIPNIGTIIALVPPTVLALLDSGAPAAAAVVVGFTLINFAQDYLLQPRMMGLELNLSPLVIFVSIIVWAWILGPAGALLAVPLTVAVVAFLEAFPASRAIALVMRDHAEGEPGLADMPGTGA